MASTIIFTEHRVPKRKQAIMITEMVKPERVYYLVCDPQGYFWTDTPHDYIGSKLPLLSITMINGAGK